MFHADAKVVNAGLLKLALRQFEEKGFLVEHLKDFSDYPSMFPHIPSRGNQDVVHVYKHLPWVSVYDLGKDPIHATLEGGRRVLKAKEHHLWLVQPKGSLKHGLLSILRANLDVMIAPTNV
jgi:hypothetical protein